MKPSSMAWRMRVEVEGDGLAVRARAAEHLQRLVLRRRREGEEGEVLLLAARGHRLDDLFLVVRRASSSAASLRGLLGDVRAGEHVLHLLGGLAASASCGPRRRSRRSAGWAAAPIFSVTKGNFCSVVMMIGVPGLERLGELLRVLVDLLDDALLVLELVDGVLQLLVEHAAVGDDDDGVEDLLVVARRAGSRAGARARRWSWSCRCRPSAGSGSCGPAPPARASASQPAHAVELVVAREDHRLALHGLAAEPSSPRSAGGGSARGCP